MASMTFVHSRLLPALAAVFVFFRCEAALATTACGDVNGSGTVNATDALAVLKATVGQTVSLICLGTAGLITSGQTQCYDASGTVVACAGTGLDGETQAGLDRSFIDNGNGTITDDVTGLIWEKESDDLTIHSFRGAYRWTEIFDKVAQLNEAKFADHDDWRIPNIREIESLVSFATVAPAAYPEFDDACNFNCTVFTCSCTVGALDFGYWSSTIYGVFPRYQRWVDTLDGRTSYNSDRFDTHTVRAVRGGFRCGDANGNGTITSSDALAILRASVGQIVTIECQPPGQLPQTSIRGCYDDQGDLLPSCAGTGQDGEFAAGAPRQFRDNGDGTITDTVTDLTWEKLSSDGTVHDYGNSYAWTGALDKITALNDAKFADHDDWRVPNIRELQSIIDFGAGAPTTYSAFLANCGPGCSVENCSCTSASPLYPYWSSSVYMFHPQQIWVADFSIGWIRGDVRTNDNLLRAVRGGASASP